MATAIRVWLLGEDPDFASQQMVVECAGQIGIQLDQVSDTLIDQLA